MENGGKKVPTAIGESEDMTEGNTLVKLLNERRENNLKRSVRLNLVAFKQAHILARANRLHHDNFSQRLGKRWSTGGEAVLYNQKGTGKSAYQQWMNSQPHRDILLNEKYEYIGVGRAKQGERIFWVAVVAA